MMRRMDWNCLYGKLNHISRNKLCGTDTALACKPADHIQKAYIISSECTVYSQNNPLYPRSTYLQALTECSQPRAANIFAHNS